MAIISHIMSRLNVLPRILNGLFTLKSVFSIGSGTYDTKMFGEVGQCWINRNLANPELQSGRYLLLVPISPWPRVTGGLGVGFGRLC